ncbi:hypothetical protein [uncultured Agrobacterium sp.]|uniref:hypothetical protein n=1 Tax=uncultured Agrobacterium sp. TaxID=157277 RepID=UPI002601138C|nr:hypothetical protein [uncultured Agrobacterium sp.]
MEPHTELTVVLRTFTGVRILAIASPAVKGPMSYGRLKNGATPLADIGLKAQALSLAVKRVAELQRQITELVLAMTGERLTEIVFAAEVKAFLRARCNLSVIELSTYMGREAP